MKRKLAELLDWKQSLNIGRDEVLGLDIGSSSVKLIQMRKNGDGYTVTAAAIAKIAPAEGEDNSRETNITKAIRECVESTGVQTQFAVCSVSGPEAAVRSFKFPPLPPEEAEGAISLEASQVCPFNAADGSVDYQLIPNGENATTGVLVAATNELIRSKTRLAESAFLNCVLMDTDGLALLNCFNGFLSCNGGHSAKNTKSKPKKSENGNSGEYEKADSGRTATAILNVGNSFTNLAIMSENTLPFIRDIAYAGKAIINSMATENNISAEQVRKVLSGGNGSVKHEQSQDQSPENPAESEPQLGDSLAAACQKLIADISETLRYYTAQEKSAAVEKIFVCGGFALAKGFVELLDKQLPAAVALWNPFDTVHCNAERNCLDIIQDNGPVLAVAAGLAMREI